MTVLFCPIFNGEQFFDPDGKPLAGGRIFATLSPSFDIPEATYTTIVGDVPNTYPIELDSSGQLTNDIWLTSGINYNFRVADVDGTTIRSVENVYGVPFPITTSGSVAADVWVTIDVETTYQTTNSFALVGNFVSEFAIGNRARVLTDSGYKYGVVSNVVGGLNTTVTLILDTGSLDSTVSSAAWSQNTVAGSTVDAGAVRYTPALGYAGANTVGNKLLSIDAAISATNARINPLRTVWAASGAGTFAITPSPAIASYSTDGVFTVKFGSASTEDATLQVNGLAPLPLKEYAPDGSLTNPKIVAGMVSDVGYDGTNFILLDQLPEVIPTPETFIVPRGASFFGTNATFTVPENVFNLKITCVGGGGGGGSGASSGGFEGTAYPGRGGGGGAVSYAWIATTPGTTYSVAIGAGGGGANRIVSGSYEPNAAAGGTTSFGISICSAAGGNPASNVIIGGPIYVATGGNTGNGFVQPGGSAIDGLGGGTPGWSMGSNAGFGSGGNGSETPGAGGPAPGNAGNAGLCVIEW